MRKSCAKPVDEVRKNVETEHYLYSTTHTLPVDYVVNPLPIPTIAHTLSHHFSTFKNRLSDLLQAHFSTFYTGLITNTTKYMYIKITY